MSDVPQGKAVLGTGARCYTQQDGIWLPVPVKKNKQRHLFSELVETMSLSNLLNSIERSGAKLVMQQRFTSPTGFRSPDNVVVYASDERVCFEELT